MRATLLLGLLITACHSPSVGTQPAHEPAPPGPSPAPSPAPLNAAGPAGPAPTAPASADRPVPADGGVPCGEFECRRYPDSGTALKRLASAEEAWNRVFGMPAGPSASDVSAQHKQTAVTNFLHARFTDLRPQLSAYDQQVLDAHLTSLRAYEEQVKKRSESTCQQPTRAAVPSDATSVRTGADTEKLAPFYMDLITSAFSCDLTKVATVTFGYPGGGDAGGLRMPWLGFTDPLHMVSHHGGNATRLDKYKQMHVWIAQQIAGLLDRLAAVKDSNGVSLLDQTVVYWFNRHGDGDSHSNWGLPNILLGGAGGYFKMGRYLQLPTTNPTQVLISIANAMGVDVPTFGEAPLAANKPLSALTG